MKKIKIFIDILLFIITILLYDIELIGNLNHEFLGISIFILAIIHIILNFKWIKQVTINFKKVDFKTKVKYIVDIFTMVIYLGAIIFGILISNEIFNFKMSSNLKMMLVHVIIGRLAIIMMFVHLGLHLDRLLIKIKKGKILIYIMYIIIVLIIMVYFIYSLTHSFQWLYVFGINNW